MRNFFVHLHQQRFANRSRNGCDEKGRWVKLPHSPRCCNSTTPRSCLLLKIFATDPSRVGKASATDKSEDLPWHLGIFTCGGRGKIIGTYHGIRLLTDFAKALAFVFWVFAQVVFRCANGHFLTFLFNLKN